MILIFAGNSYYPDGGMDDYKPAMSFEAAMSLLRDGSYDWIQTFDVETLEIKRYGQNDLSDFDDLYQAV